MFCISRCLTLHKLQEYLKLFRYLIEHGANVAAVNNDGDLPIDIAESNEMEDYLSDVLDEQGIYLFKKNHS